MSTLHYRSSIKNLTLLLGIWAESRLDKLLAEPGAFTDIEADIINLYRQKIQQWTVIVELAFRKHYAIYIGEDLNEKTLGHKVFSRYTTIQNIIKERLKLIIEIKNKLAHGHWCCQVNPKRTGLSNKAIEELNNENYISLQVKYQILQKLGDLIYLLVVSNSDFDAQFDKLYKEINDREIRLSKHIEREHSRLVSTLQLKI